MDLNSYCPCGSKKTFQNCCEPIICSKRNAATAEQLMRSRYTAFTLANVNYLMQSHHSKTRPLKDKKQIERWAKSVNWMGLVVLNTQWGFENDSKGFVEFQAIYSENGTLQKLHEKSFFEKENDKWVYVSGTFK